jgi:predicted esterase
MISTTRTRGAVVAHWMTIALVACGGGSDGSPTSAAPSGAPGSSSTGGVVAGGPGTAGSGTAGSGTAGSASPGGGAGAGGNVATQGGAGSAGQSPAAGTAAGGANASGGGGASTGGAGGQSAGASGNAGQAGMPGGRSISFGTLLDAQTVMTSARALAKSLAKPGSAQWRAKGDQHRKYRSTDTGADEPYRIYVPTNWDGAANLPLAMFLHGSGSDENNYLDQNNQQLIKLAQQHGYLLVSPLGVSGAYGNFLRLAAPFGNEAAAAQLMAAVTPQTERTNELSEQDVINVLELVLNEYPIDPKGLFLFGHSMGSGGTWYIGGKYPTYWRGLAPMSGPFVLEHGYPWDGLRSLSLFVTEGTQAPSIDASKLLVAWLSKNNFTSQYKEVNADHDGMIPLVLPDVFSFFDAARGK